MYDRLYELLDTYRFFIEGEWIYKADKTVELAKLLPEDQKQEFDFDIKSIEWTTYLYQYISGISIWVLKEQKISPEHGLNQLMH